MSAPRIAIYGALSKAGEDEGSIETQVATVRARLEQIYPDGYELLGTFTDDGYSGSKRDRGPGLAGAIGACVNAAEDGPVELWANTSARFGRGSGRRNEARAIGALFYDLRSRGVGLRTVHDDEFVTNEMLIGFASRQASKYAEDLGESLTRAKRREAAKGQHPGGPVCDGYRVERELDQHGRASRTYQLDPLRAPIVRRIFELKAHGLGDPTIARALNAEGIRTRKGRPFDRRSVQAIATNGFYAGRIVFHRGKLDEEVFDGQHPALIEPALFDRLLAARREADNAPDSHSPVRGRPPSNHALARLAVCGRCGERMTGYTSPYRRKSDGGRRREYRCLNYHRATGLCDAKPIDAVLVDAAVASDLRTLLVDFESWRTRIEDRHAAEREHLARDLDRVERDLEQQAHRTEAVERKWAEYIATDQRKADLVLPIVERERQALQNAETHHQAAQDALSSVPTEAPVDAMLDFMNGLQRAINGRLEDTSSLGDVNTALRDLFSRFALSTGPRMYEGPNGKLRFDSERCEILVQPFLRADVLTWAREWALADHEGWPKLVPADEEPPPLHHVTAHLSETPPQPRRSGG